MRTRKILWLTTATLFNALPTSARRASDAELAYDSRIRRRRAKLRKWLLSLLILFAPLAVTVIYKFAISVPMYVSEVRFGIRGGTAAQNPSSSSSGGTSLSSIASQLGGAVDGYAVRDFLSSRDAMKELDQKIDFGERMKNPGPSLLDRLLNRSPSDKEYDLYQSAIDVRFNLLEQTVAMRVYAYSPADAQTMASNLLSISETFLDKMNVRSRRDWLRLMENEVKQAEDQLSDARTALADWQTKNGNVDPVASIQMLNTILGQIETSIATARVNLAQFVGLGSDTSPRQRAIQGQIAALMEQERSIRDRLAGLNNSQAGQLMQFEKLKANADFAEKNLYAARSSLEDARVESARQQKYVEVFASPSQSESVAFPDTFALFSGALVVGASLLFLGSLTVGLARDALAR
ncbi:hypothetical protein [Labrys wisconsinensis]|uniref:Capsular polysaccharide transport system permease protein n=1 Tax=Labrys wisconsinensis TaxID=425677 RepID=A0ABU0J9T7_9HYPH|nr:hypothetical protein [Labrys wisconsinensis]MDQ0469937.1 capsular polysaccharide transport system permease protein [Labrys wisconsinensis]